MPGVLGSANVLSGKIKGMQGYVIDGACRDSAETIREGIPVWCTVRSFSRVEWRIKFGRLNEEIHRRAPDRSYAIVRKSDPDM